MFQRSDLQLLGSRVLAGGLVVAAVTLSVVIADQMLTGGTLAIRATCVLFLWTSGGAILLGMILRIVGARPRSARPIPRPRPRRRSRRTPTWH